MKLGWDGEKIKLASKDSSKSIKGGYLPVEVKSSLYYQTCSKTLLIVAFDLKSSNGSTPNGFVYPIIKLAKFLEGKDANLLVTDDSHVPATNMERINPHVRFLVLLLASPCHSSVLRERSHPLVEAEISLSILSDWS